MCGIIAYIGKDNAIKNVRNGLKSLEYRGYDSAGITFFEKGIFKTIKRAGTVDNLFLYVSNYADSHIAIGHTRWATHGKASDQNSHPHLSFYGKVSVVHNGIIENFEEIKQSQLMGIKFKSETDTEVISNLIEKNYILTNNRLLSIANTIKTLKGSFAIAIMFSDDAEKIYFAKNFSPLVIGESQSGNFVASDILGFCGNATKYVEVDDMQLGYISYNEIAVFDKDLKMQKIESKYVAQVNSISNKNGYPYFMIKEINEIPQAIINTTKLYSDRNSPLKKINWKQLPKKRIWLIGCGTSYHACIVGQKLLTRKGFDATAEIASEFIYESPVLDKDTLCIFLSQSGETADTISAIKVAKSFYAKTVCITNVLTSTIAKICDYTLPIACGTEIAVASTKAYNSQLVALYIFSEYLKSGKSTISPLINKINKLSKLINIEKMESQIKPLVKELISQKNIFFVGRNFDYISALESALKLKEISYLNCWAVASGELKHGTIALVDENTLILAFINEKKLIDKTMNVVMQTKARGAKVCVISQFDFSANKDIDFFINLPEVEEQLCPAISIVAMQLLAYHLSVTLGHNPDKPRNLAKSVTVE